MQGWAWRLFSIRRQGRCLCPPGDELQSNTPMDSCHYKIHVLKSSEQLCNGRGASFNRPFVQQRHWEAETNPDTSGTSLSPGYNSSFWGIRRQVQVWSRLLNTPQSFYLSQAHPLPILRAVPGTKFPSSRVASVTLSTPSIFLVGFFILSEHFKGRFSLSLQSDVPSNHF